MHPWFSRIDWNAILTKKIRPPFIPKVKNELDVSCFDDEFVSGDVHSMSDSSSSLKDKVRNYEGNF